MRVLERLARETGREYALRVLKENIVGLDLLPGSMLSENEIASCLNLSRTPVREAFIELSKVKIVEIYPQKGSVVSLIDYNMVEEARFMRHVLECAVVELVCEKITPDWIRKLEENVTLQQFHLDNHRPERLLELDNEFHEAILDLVSFMRLKKAWEDLNYGNIVIGYNMAVDSDQVIKRQYLIHEKLLSACKTGTTAQVEQAIADHYLVGVEKLIQKVDKKHEK